MPEPKKNREDYLAERYSRQMSSDLELHESSTDASKENNHTLTDKENKTNSASDTDGLKTDKAKAQQDKDNATKLANTDSESQVIDPSSKELTEHLTEIRNRAIIVIISLLAITLIAFNYSEFFVKILQKCAPTGSSFFQLKPGEMFFSSFKVAIFVGVSFSLPVISHHIYYFLEPGLTKRESKILKPIMLAAPALFFVGLVFAYFLVLPPLLEFLLGFNQDVIEARYGIQYFLDLCISLLIVTGITFQLPIVLFSLNWFKIIKPSYLIKIWRYVVLGAFLLSAVITPTPDPLTMSILASALLVLYFGTYLILRIFGKN